MVLWIGVTHATPSWDSVHLVESEGIRTNLSTEGGWLGGFQAQWDQSDSNCWFMGVQYGALELTWDQWSYRTQTEHFC